MPEIVELSAAVDELVRDGATVALEGTGDLAPFAAAHEIIRRRRRDLTVVRSVADVLADRLVGAGCVGTLVFARADGPGDRPLPRLRDALSRQWPCPLRLEEHSTPGLAARYDAAARGLPFGLLRDTGSDLAHHTAAMATVRCPFTGAIVAAVAALAPDVTVAHAHRADRAGNVQLTAPLGMRKEAVLAGRTALVTVDEIVDSFDPEPGAVVVPAVFLRAVAVAPARGDTGLDGWPELASDRDRFTTWLDALGATP